MSSHRERKEKAAKFFVENERPEEFAKDPKLYYTDDRVKEYANSKALMRIQEKITKRALDIARVSLPARVLDLGMGSGFASCVLYLKGYQVVGIDLNRLFLTTYSIQEYNPIEADMRWLTFRPASFDLIISISAVQWLLAESDQSKRLSLLQSFAHLCAQCLNSKGKMVVQFYPKSDGAMKELGGIFSDTNEFSGNFIIDNSDSPRKRRVFMYLERK